MENDRDTQAKQSVEINEHGGLMYSNPSVSTNTPQEARSFYRSRNEPNFATALFAEGLLGLTDQPAGLPKGETVLSMLDRCIGSMERHLQLHPMDSLTEEALQHLYQAKRKLTANEDNHDNARFAHSEGGLN